MKWALPIHSNIHRQSTILFVHFAIYPTPLPSLSTSTSSPTHPCQNIPAFSASQFLNLRPSVPLTPAQTCSILSCFTYTPIQILTHTNTHTGSPSTQSTIMAPPSTSVSSSSSSKSTKYIASVVSAYWCISISMVYINKVLMTNTNLSIPAPLFVTWFQCLFTVGLCYICGTSFVYVCVCLYICQ